MEPELTRILGALAPLPSSSLSASPSPILPARFLLCLTLGDPKIPSISTSSSSSLSIFASSPPSEPPSLFEFALWFDFDINLEGDSGEIPEVAMIKDRSRFVLRGVENEPRTSSDSPTSLANPSASCGREGVIVRSPSSRCASRPCSSAVESSSSLSRPTTFFFAPPRSPRGLLTPALIGAYVSSKSIPTPKSGCKSSPAPSPLGDELRNTLPRAVPVRVRLIGDGDELACDPDRDPDADLARGAGEEKGNGL